MSASLIDNCLLSIVHCKEHVFVFDKALQFAVVYFLQPRIEFQCEYFCIHSVYDIY